MIEILAALKEVTDALESVDNLIAQEINEDAAELRSAYQTTVANAWRASQAAGVLRDARAGIVPSEAAPYQRHPDDDAD